MTFGRNGRISIGLFSRYRLRQLVVIGLLFVAAMSVLRAFTDVSVSTPFAFFTSKRAKMNADNQNYMIAEDVETAAEDEVDDDGRKILDKMVCQRPRLELNNPALKGFFKSVEPLDCGKVDDLVCVQGGRASLCNQAALDYPNLSCQYVFFDRVDEDTNKVVGEKAVIGNVPVVLESDFFHVKCKGESKDGNRITWKNLMMGLHADSNVLERTYSSPNELPDNELGLNVLMLGFDSMSRLTFMRKLPLSYKFLTEELGSVVLKGYNIVGDGTPQALIPILTGFTEPELPDTRKRMGDAAMHVNVYPFVWREYVKKGYVTSYAEDLPHLGTFTYRLKGFDERPTDHYLRPFYIEYNKYKNEHENLCIGARPSHKVMMDWVVDFFNFYPERPKFFFGFQGQLSHDDINLIENADNDLRNFLRTLKEKDHLNNTMLIVMSDHGHRFSALRETQQGKQEERLPFFSFVLPPRFKSKYPKAFNNLKKNAHRLTSPFDIHATLQSVLNYNFDDVPKQNQRSISLFSEVPLSRRCEDANIEPHWCACLSWESTSTDDEAVRRVAVELVNYINNLTEPYRSLCQKLSLNELVRADKYTPQSELLKYKKNLDMDGFEGDFTDNTVVSDVVYQVKVNTKPGDGHYEASIVHRLAKDTFVVKSSDISRVNAYGDAAACIKDIQQDLRKYCYCGT